MKPFYLSKTLWFNLITVIITIIALPEVTHLIPTAGIPYIGLINAVGNAILRIYTTQPLE